MDHVRGECVGHRRQYPAGPDVAPRLRRRSPRAASTSRSGCTARRPTVWPEARSGSARATTAVGHGRSRGFQAPARRRPAPIQHPAEPRRRPGIRPGDGPAASTTCASAPRWERLHALERWRRDLGPADPGERVRWSAANLDGVVNGAGLRERAERTADGDVVWVYGDGRLARGAKPGRTAIFATRIDLTMS